MKIIKGADRGRTEWTARKLVELVEDGTVNFNIDIQRGYVWKDNEKKSTLIRSLILDRHIPPLYFNKVEDVYEGEDGKQRTLTIIKFLKDGFELSGLEEFTVINDEGETEEIDINGYKFSNLPECFQNAIKEYSFTICYTDNADQEEQADTFYNLNNGQALNAATMNRVKAKSKEQIIRLGKHKLFTDALYRTNSFRCTLCRMVSFFNFPYRTFYKLPCIHCCFRTLVCKFPYLVCNNCKTTARLTCPCRLYRCI